jgi:lysophospholipase L1-like esterase
MRLVLFLISLVLICSLAALGQAPSALPAGQQAPGQARTAPVQLGPPPIPGLPSELQMAARVLRDWPNLARYQDSNAQLPPPAANENRVVFMGDSITDGWARRFPQAFPGKPYVGRGISGQTTPQMLVRFRPDVINLKPKVVVILAGTNDIAGNTGPMTIEQVEGNLASMAELAKANGIKVVLCSVMPVTDYYRPQTAQRSPEKIIAINAWMKDYAEKNGHVYLDYYSAMLDEQKMLKKEITADGLHPNDAGYALIEPMVEKAIAEALRK